MARATVDLGIDLGTTNSAIGIMRGTAVDVLKNNDNHELTPSAVHIDRWGVLHVGWHAKGQVEFDPDNSATEFKLDMGTDKGKMFARSGRRLRPEDLSAEVLKALRLNAERVGEDLRAAVITVPAEFDLPENEATRRAANMAGIEYVELLQEPIAASLPYGFMAAQNNTFWLVYDFGGGTFDAAVIQIKDGAIHVINHGGDKHLGGKNIDWEIVDKVLAPRVAQQFGLKNFSRQHDQWYHAFAKLKQHAERAKIRISSETIVRDEISDLFKGCPEFTGGDSDFAFVIERQDIEPLMDPFIERSLNISRKVLSEKGLAPEHMEKVLLVGGPTQTPRFRERLADKRTGLKIPLDYSIDPMTVVAKGAALHAASVRMPRLGAASTPAGTFQLDLDYTPVGADTEPIVSGKVVHPSGGNLSGYSIEFVARPSYRSGRISVQANGGFLANLLANKEGTTTFEVYLYSSDGAQVPTALDRFAYRVGLEVAAPPLTHSIGVVLVDGRVKVLIPRGIPLPAKGTYSFEQSYFIKAGHPVEGNMIRIPVVEGENLLRADRNRLIGYIDVGATEVRRDVPVGTEIEVTVSVDRSRIVKVSAYVPLLDEEFETELRLSKPAPQYQILKADADAVLSDLETARRQVRESGDPQALGLIEETDREGKVGQIYMNLPVASSDDSTAYQVQSDIQQLRTTVDRVTDLLQWPTLVKEVERELARTRRLVTRHGDAQQKERFDELETEVQRAIKDEAIDLLRMKKGALVDLYFEVYRQLPEFWTEFFEYLLSRRETMREQGKVGTLIAQGKTAVAAGDMEDLRDVVFELFELLPAEDKRSAGGMLGSSIREKGA